MLCVKFSNLLQINSKILQKALCLIYLPKYWAENKMNLFGLFLLFILKWWAGKQYGLTCLALSIKF